MFAAYLHICWRTTSKQQVVFSVFFSDTLHTAFILGLAWCSQLANSALILSSTGWLLLFTKWAAEFTSSCRAWGSWLIAVWNRIEFLIYCISYSTFQCHIANVCWVFEYSCWVHFNLCCIIYYYFLLLLFSFKSLSVGTFTGLNFQLKSVHVGSNVVQYQMFLCYSSPIDAFLSSGLNFFSD